MTTDPYDETVWNENFGDLDAEDQLEILTLTGESLEELAPEILSDDPERIRLSAHKLVSVLGTVGYVTPSQQAREIEQNAHDSGFIAEVQQDFSSLLIQVKTSVDGRIEVLAG
jgi:HPt (histidine-containing phosphotransfer) domain-containing protein